MGSILSGRRNGKPLVENCLTLDLAWLMRLGPIRDGQVRNGTVKWHADGLPIGSVRFRLDLRERAAARLMLNLRRDGADPIRQTVALTSTDQNFGGRRWWMRCPLTGKRARTLHLMPDGLQFASRAALGLAYRVERLDHFDRPFERISRLQRRLGTPQGLGMGLERPKGMWRRTHHRHLAHLARLDQACLGEISKLIDGA